MIMVLVAVCAKEINAQTQKAKIDADFFILKIPHKVMRFGESLIILREYIHNTDLWFVLFYKQHFLILELRKA